MNGAHTLGRTFAAACGQLQATTVDRDTRNLPPDQQPAVEGTLGLAIVRLLDLARKAQGPNQPCYFPAGSRR